MRGSNGGKWHKKRMGSQLSIPEITRYYFSSLGRTRMRICSNVMDAATPIPTTTTSPQGTGLRYARTPITIQYSKNATRATHQTGPRMTRRTIGAQNEIRLSNMKNTATKLNTAISCMVSGLIDMHSHLFQFINNQYQLVTVIIPHTTPCSSLIAPI